MKLFLLNSKKQTVIEDIKRNKKTKLSKLRKTFKGSKITQRSKNYLK